MNWNRAQLKGKGKTAFMRNYWKCVIVALVFLFVAGNNGSNSSIKEKFSKQKDSTKIKISKELSKDSIKDFLGDFSSGATLADDISDIVSNVVGAVGMGVAAIVTVIVALISVALALALKILVFNPLETGCQRFFIDNAYSEQATPKLIASAFKNGFYGNVAVTMFMRDLYIFLWTLLLIVPGIIKMYEYRMVSYILAEHPDMQRDEVLNLSKQMMEGQKWEAFVLDLSFIGWHILSSITFGILKVFYVAPYQCATNAELYLTLRGNHNNYNLYDNSPTWNEPFASN